MLAKEVNTHMLRTTDQRTGVWEAQRLPHTASASTEAERGGGTLLRQSLSDCHCGDGEAFWEECGEGPYTSSTQVSCLRSRGNPAWDLLPFPKWGLGAVDWEFLTRTFAVCWKVTKWLR